MYLATIKYEKMTESGVSKKVSEKYLLNGAESFADAENTIIGYMADVIDGEFSVYELKMVNYAGVVACEDESTKFYSVKVAFVMLDEKSGKEKFSCHTYLVEAPTINTALKKFDAYMKDTMSDYFVQSVSETKIMAYWDGDE